MNIQNLQWLFFDMGGVILDDSKPEQIRQRVVFEVTKKYRPETTIEDVKGAWMESSKLPGRVRLNALRFILKDSRYLSEAEEDFTQEDKLDYHALSTIRPEAKMVLEKLSQKYHLGMMANQSIKTIKLLEASGIIEHFSHQKMSEHLSLEKPDPAFFQAILQDCKTDPQHSANIDDNWFRGLWPAKQLGMTTVLYDRETIPNPINRTPDFTVKKLEELLDIFL